MTDENEIYVSMKIDFEPLKQKLEALDDAIVATRNALYDLQDTYRDATFRVTDVAQEQPRP